MTIDFTSIIAATGIAWSHDPADVLAARVPDLCLDCHGTGKRPCPDDTDGDGDCGFCSKPWNVHVCTHPDAPTIGKLLTIGAAVMTATVDERAAKVVLNGNTATTDGVQFLLRVLRAVEQ